jgi:hypothetical protein
MDNKNWWQSSINRNEFQGNCGIYLPFRIRKRNEESFKELQIPLITKFISEETEKKRRDRMSSGGIPNNILKYIKKIHVWEDFWPKDYIL